jgi:SAM-dependent methyltransferase
MPLVPLASIADDLVCPRCRRPVTADAERYACRAADCGASFPVLAGHPVLVDFTQSILDEKEVAARDAGSAIRRGPATGLKSSLVRALTPANRVAAANAARLIALLKERTPAPTLLIVGGGSAGEGTDALYHDASLSIVAFDIYASDLTQFIADAHRVPLADGSVDGVWIQAVLEHVLDPSTVAGEIHRVLGDGGLVYAETPFLQQVHEGAFDFTRFTESGHRWLFRHFVELDSGVVLGAGSQLLWSIDHFVRGVFRSVRAGIIARMLLSWLALFDRVIPREYASDAASAVYFLGRKADTLITPRDMVSYYKGAHSRRA